MAALLAVTAAAYYPAWHGGILWDDAAHLTAPHLRSIDGLWRIWFEIGATQQYYPLVHSVFWLAHRLWGDATFGYNLLNIGLHALSAFLVAVILRRLRVPWGGLAALMFALHPVQVESVAWMTELKNTLSGTLVLAACLAYLRFDERRERRAYALALVLFALALLSKTVTAVLPGVLLVVFWWQRGRVTTRRDILPLVPFTLLGAAGGLLTAWVERTVIGAQGAAYDLTLLERGLLAGRAIWFYLGKLLWPANLLFVYPRWDISQRDVWQFLYPLAVIALLAVLWTIRRRSRAPLAAMLIFCGTLFPALGFVNVYPFRFSFVADHFQYLAAIPVFALMSAALAWLANRVAMAPRTAAATAALVLGTGLALLTWNQSRLYADAETLYRATLDRNPSCWLAHNNLAEIQLERGDLNEAMVHIDEALRLQPDVAEAHTNRGFAFQRMGRLQEAIAEHTEALRLNPSLAQAHNNLATAFLALGRATDAIPHYETALRLRPGYAEAASNLGVALATTGRVEQGMALLRDTIRQNPGYGAAHFNLALMLHRAGRPAEAVPEYIETLRVQGESAAVHNLAGDALERLGHLDEALVHYRSAARLDPALSGVSESIARVSAKLRQP